MPASARLDLGHDALHLAGEALALRGDQVQHVFYQEDRFARVDAELLEEERLQPGT